MYGRPLGGLLWGGILRVTLVHHFTFFINSLCHFIGKRTYELDTTARDSWFMALFTFGEGYHNFHHKFQWDYRIGVSWYSFDPSKWIIKILSYFNITYELRQASEHSILKAKIMTLHQKINNLSGIKNNYKNRMKKIMNHSSKNLKSLMIVEKKYELIKKQSISNYQKLFYESKIKKHKIELQQSFSSLMIIFLNLKNL